MNLNLPSYTTQHFLQPHSIPKKLIITLYLIPGWSPELNQSSDSKCQSRFYYDEHYNIYIIYCIGLLRRSKKSSIYKNVKRYRTQLLKFIEPRFGLVEELVALSVLGIPDLEIVRSKDCTTEKNKQIINFVMKKSPMETDKFLEALSSTYQQHVVNYILYAAGIMQFYTLQSGICRVALHMCNDIAFSKKYCRKFP